MNLPPRILIVEDDPNDVLLFKRALGKILPGLDVEVASDGQEAVRRLAREEPCSSDRSRYPRPSHVVLDLKLPRKSGLEVLEWIRGQPELSSLRVVILTSSKQSTDLERVYRAGIDKYCVKPVSFTDLVECFRAILECWNLLPLSDAANNPAGRLGKSIQPRQE